jgi:5'-AMP-activated protein kinase catalytic alpha subunit
MNNMEFVGTESFGAINQPN